MATEAIRWYIERGWDYVYGGIFLTGNAKGGVSVWHQPDSKVWWPITEAMFALLLAYEHIRADWCLDWYNKVHEYAFRMYPNHTSGDWHQNLDRKGNRIPVVLRSLAAKDRFHLPRSLLYCSQVLGRLARL